MQQQPQMPSVAIDQPIADPLTPVEPMDAQPVAPAVEPTQPPAPAVSPEMIAQNDDMSGSYQKHREDFAQNTAAAELLQRVNARKAPEVPQPAPKEDQQKIKPPIPQQGGALATAGAFASDVGRGIIEAPLQIVGGAVDALNEASDLAKSAGDWLNKNVIDTGGIVVDGDGVRWVPGEEIAKRPNEVTLPTTAKAESTTGGMVRSVAQFLAGFVGAGKVTGPAKLAGKIGKTGEAAAKGAIADFTAFDPQQERLSNLVQEYPALQNPVNDFLAAKPEDGEAEGRFKNALEGLGLGVLTDGVVLGLKTLRSANIARMAQQAPVPEAPRPRVSEDAFKILGNTAPDAPLIQMPEIKPTADALPATADAVNLDVKAPNNVDFSPGPATQETANGLPINTTEKPLLSAQEMLEPAVLPSRAQINFARIDTPEDVQNVMQQMADAYKPEVDTARRGKQTFAQIELNAEQLNAWDVLSARRAGDPLNAEQSVAARNLWASSGAKLAETAKAAAANPSEENLFAFRKMMSVHKAVQNEVMAARTETARALASWRIPAGGSAEQLQSISQMLLANGGNDVTREMATRMASLAENGMTKELDAFVEKGVWATTRDAMLEAWINSLLSGPKTHLVNMVSNTSVLFQQMYERGTAAKIAQVLGDNDSVQMGEAAAQYAGMIGGLKDAFRYARQTFKTGESGFGLGKTELAQDKAISSAAFNLASDTWLGRSVDLLGHTINIPTRALGAADEFFKTVGYRMELNALALRQAAQEVHGGKIKPEDMKSRIADIVANPPESIRLNAIDQATYQTFTNTPGALAQAISRIKNQFPAANIILPFVRTPANIMTYTFERTPLAPLMKHVRSDFAAGGARRDLAAARLATGTTIMLVTADMAMSGQITGKGPANTSERQAMQRNGWQPYSVKVGDRYWAYNRLDPIGMTMGLAADMVEITANDDYGVEKEKSIEEATVAIALSIANNTMSKTYLRGLSDFMEAMTDPERFGESYFQGLAGSLVPTGVAEVAKFEDPYMREVGTMLEALRKRTPGLSDSLPVRRDLWGKAVSYQSGLGGLYDALSPIYSKQLKPEPIDSEILRLEANVTQATKKTSFDGVTVDLEKYPEIYSRYVQLAGNELKHPAWNQGAKDFLNDLVTGKSQLSPVYDMKSDGPDGGKQDYIKKIVNDYRNLARQQILEEYPQLAAEVEEKQRKKREIKMPQFGGFTP